MTDAQFTILIAVIGSGLTGLVAVIKWSVGRVVTAIDANSTSMIENTKSNAVLATKIDSIANFVQQTPAHGIRIVRPRTRGEDE